MKTIDMVLATRNRYDKLLRMIKSVPPLRNLNIHVVFDGDRSGFESFSLDDPFMSLDVLARERDDARIFGGRD